MPSEFNHIDDFFRRKESEASSNQSMQDRHWQLMKQMIGSTQPISRVKFLSGKRLLKWEGGLVTVAALIILILLFNEKRYRQEAAVVSPPSENFTQPLTEIPVDKTAARGDSNLKNQSKTAQVEDTRSEAIQPAPENERKYLISKIDTIAASGVHESLRSKDIQTLADLFGKVQKPHQEFLIDSEKDTILYGKDGTSVLIPAHSLTRSNGAKVRGQVNFRLNEFYEIADIISYKLTTASDKEILETGGMLYLEAFQENEKLSLTNQAAIRITMPTERFDPEMQLFYGDTVHGIHPEPYPEAVMNGSINWNAAGLKQYYYNFENWTIAKIDYANDPRVVVTRRGKRIAKFISPFTEKHDLEVTMSELKIRHGYLYDDIKVRHGWKKKTLSPTDSVPYRDGMVGEQIRLTLKQARQLKLISARDSIWQLEQWKKQVERSDSMLRQHLELRDQYSFNITNLGWINCDKLLAIQAPRVRFYVYTGEAFKDTYFQSFLVFKDMNSIIAGEWENGRLIFDKMPAGKRVTLVCVGIKNGKAYSSTTETQISSRIMDGLDFQETTPEKFREGLKKFGNVIRR